MKKLYSILVIALLTMCFNVVSAQEYRYEVGAGLGLSGYIGDANKGNMWRSPSYAAGGVFRYIINSRWALKGNLFTAKISGDSSKDNNVYPGGLTYKFNSQLFDVGAQIEFNFLNFGMGSKYLKLKRISPYMVLGLGATVASYNAEGNKGTSAALNLPMGVGLKYKISERLNIGLEFTMRKAFGDRLDGLNDLNGIKSGFAKNTEWYSLTMFSLTYEFSKRCKACHYVE